MSSVDHLHRLPASARRALYYGLQRAIGSRIGATYRDFLSWTRATRGELDDRVESALSAVLLDALSSVEYYRRLGIDRHASRSALELLRRFPILSREQIRSRFSALVSDPLRAQIQSPESTPRGRYDWIVVKTGGTTGIPTSVVHDAGCRDWGRASRLFSQRQCGFPLGTRYFRLWGSEEDLLQAEVRLDKRVLSQLLGELPLNAFRGHAEDLRAHLDAMNSASHVRHLMAYVDAAASLAEFSEMHGLRAPKLKTVMACAGNVTAEARTVLQRVFGAEVFDKYGSRECADIACECAQHSGLHINSPHVFVEIVDDHGSPCPPGVTGRLLVTMLRNRGFPMIRYEIGDLGSWTEPGPCACGLPFPRLAALEGRADDRLVAADGTLLSSVFVRHFVGVSLNREAIKEWQFEQRGPREFVFRFVPLATTLLGDTLAALRQRFEAVLGAQARIEMDRVERIPRSPSGKQRWVINSYRELSRGS